MTRPQASTRSLFAGAGVAAILTLPSLASAQDASPAAASPDEIVVVANRAPDPLSKIGVSVSVINDQTIKASQAVTLSDLLEQSPGLSVVRNGGEGQTTSVLIRGADSDQTLVLIDGVQINDPGAPSGGYDFGDVLTGDISRVEILRGAQSTLWGSQAIGGVVNIVTAEPSQALEGSLNAEGGSRGTQYYRAGVGGTLDRLSFRLAGGYYSTDGVSAFGKAFGGKELDGYDNSAFSGRLGYAFTPDVQLDLRGYVTHSHVDFDGFDNPNGVFGDDNEYGTTDQYIGYAGLNFSLLDGRLKNRVAAQYTDINRRLYDPGPYYPADFFFAPPPSPETFYSYGHNVRLEYQGTFQIADGYRAVFGAQHERSSITSDTPAFDFGPTPPLKGHADLDSGYAQIEGEVVKNLNLTAGVRYDDHSTFGGHTTAQTAAAWSLNGGATLLRASFAQGFKAPALYQLFSPYGTTNLKPEEANSWDAGIEQHFWDRRVVVSATYFGRDTSNLIAFVDTDSPPFGAYHNVAKASAEGVELQGQIRPIQALTLAANYTYTDAEDLTAHKQLPRRSRNAANVSASFVWPVHLTTAITVRYAGSSYNDAANTQPLKAYTLVDLRASYPLTQRFEVYGRIENLFDRRYETAFQYGSLGRGAFIGVRAKF
jgi:vitamin B12 transporter